MDLKLDDHDMGITNGELSFVTGAEAIAQDVTMALRTFLGECVYDQTVGVPYSQVIFSRSPNLDAIRSILQGIVNRRPGVIGSVLTPQLDNVTRTLTVTGTITSTDGEIDFSEVLGVS